MSRLLATIPKSNGQELRISIELLPSSDDLEYLDMRLWMHDERKQRDFRTNCGFSMGPRRLEELRAAIDEAIEYFAEKKRAAEKRRQAG